MQSSKPSKATTSTGLRQNRLKDIILQWDSSQGSDPVIKAINSQAVESEFFHDLEKDPNYIQVCFFFSNFPQAKICVTDHQEMGKDSCSFC
jgi:hypothetical protein